MIIYKITNKINNKVYIGQTSETLKKRFSRHMGYQSIEHDTKFYRAVRKYGKDNFIIEQIDTALTQEELDKKEVKWIKYYNSVEEGYNSNDREGKVGGDTLTNHPNIEAIGKKIAETKMGSKNPQARGVKATNIITNEVKIYGSFSECQSDLDIPRHDIIGRRCRGRIKKPYNNIWKFEYIN